MRTISLTYYADGSWTTKQSFSFAAGEKLRLRFTPSATTDMTGKTFRLVFSDTPADAPLINSTTFDFVSAAVGTFDFTNASSTVTLDTATFEFPTDSMNVEIWNATDGILMRRYVGNCTANPRANGEAPSYPDPPIDWADVANKPWTTVGQAVFTSTNPSAITFLRANADNTVSWLSASAFRTAIGAGTGDLTKSGAYVDNQILRADGTAGAVQASGVTINDTGDIANVNNIDTVTIYTDSLYLHDTTDTYEVNVDAPTLTDDRTATFRDVSGYIAVIDGTLAVASGKTFTASNTLTLTGTDGSTLNVGAGGTLGALATVTPGTGVATALAVNVGSAGAVVVNGGALGTPSSGTLTSCTGLPVSTGISGLGTGVATFLATPSSANLATAVTDETGSGSLVFASAPALVSPTITQASTSTRGLVITSIASTSVNPFEHRRASDNAAINYVKAGTDTWHTLAGLNCGGTSTPGTGRLRVEGGPPVLEFIQSGVGAMYIFLSTDFYLRTDGSQLVRLQDISTTSGGVAIGSTGSIAGKLQVETGAAAVCVGVFKAATSQSANIFEARSQADAVLSTISENGYYTTRKTSAPADAELSASELAWWFDDTNGAAKAMFKGKSANGTVVTGSVTLS